MFVNPPPQFAHCRPPHRQGGVVLVVALIILVALTLAGVALIRSVDTANIIAGNLAFHQSATNAGERGTERAVYCLDRLDKDKLHAGTKGYVAHRVDPDDVGLDDGDWDNFWTGTLDDDGQAMPANSPYLEDTCPEDAAATPDAAGNTVRYVIHRLCETTGKPNTTAPPNPCTQPPPSASSGGSQSSGGIAPAAPKQVYYRITTRIDGPRGTVSYIQTIVAI
ncbi:MAG: hypothetical protein V5B33_02635 [Candidatus Accumulibacter sp. UW20]|jgi:type IV pilus assembly protein PilX